MENITSNKFKLWVVNNKYPLIVLFTIYQMAVLSIGIINYPYIDDVARQLSGDTNFYIHYSRGVSELASWFFQGSRHLTDTGLTNHMLTGLFLGIASTILVSCLTRKITVLSAVASTIVGLNPWFLQCISFRFDSPFMALSVLFSFLPFLWWNGKKSKFFVISAISLFFMCNTYQSSSGIYIVMVLAMALKDLLAEKNPLDTLQKSIVGAGAYILGLVAFSFETTMNPDLALRGNLVKTAQISEMPITFFNNMKMYFTTIYQQSNKLWVLLFAIIVISFILSVILTSKLHVLKSLGLSIVYLILSSIFSYGVYLIFIDPVATYQPRYAYGFGIFVAITIVLLVDNLNLAHVFIRIPLQFIVCVFSYYILTFPFVYASSLHYQLETFENQSVLLATELKDLVDENTQHVYATRFFNNSPVYSNTLRNYEILGKLVPANTSMYWPNQALFSTITGMNKNIENFNPDTIDLNDQSIETDNYYYKIYKQENNVYIIMK